MTEELTPHPGLGNFIKDVEKTAEKSMSLIRSNTRPNKAVKLHYQLLKDMDKTVRNKTACGGCSGGWCCNIPTTISTTDAERIRDKYGFEFDPNAGVSPEVYKARPILRYAEHTPCVFHKDGKCSVYDARPVNCILHYNLCSNEDGCRTIDGVIIMTDGIESLSNNGMSPINLLRCAEPTMLAKSGKVPKVADIREFFKDVVL